MARPVSEQTVVITGASSGIGRETAIHFGRAGASVVLAARNEIGLGEAAREVEQAGGRAHARVTDVAEWDQVERLAQAAIDRFGGIDTWVNNAAVSEYANFEQMTVEEIDRIVRVNLLGVMYGMKAALPHLKRRGGGTIINVGSGLGERAVPLQSVYVATKHGVKGITDAVRLEQEHEQSGVVLTLIEPASINTPFFNHARSKMGVKPMPMPPAYEPSSVAEAIVFAAEHPRRTIFVGSAGRMLSMLQGLSPTLTDRLMTTGGAGFKAQQSSQPDDGRDTLFAPIPEKGSTTGEWGHLSKGNSLYTRYLELYPNRKRLALAAALVGGAVLLRRVCW